MDEDQNQQTNNSETPAPDNMNMMGESSFGGDEEESKLGYLVWGLVVVVLVVAVWFFFVKDGEVSSDEPVDTRTNLEIIEQDGVNIENVSKIYNTGDIPFPDDAIILFSNIDYDLEIQNINFQYLSSGQSAEQLRTLYIDWASGKGFEVTEEENPRRIFVVDGEGNTLRVTISESGGGREVSMISY